MRGTYSPAGLRDEPYLLLRKCTRQRVNKIVVKKKLLLKFSFHLTTNKLAIIWPGEGGRERVKCSFVLEQRPSTKRPPEQRGYAIFSLTFPFFLRTKRTTSDQPDGWCEKKSNIWANQDRRRKTTLSTKRYTTLYLYTISENLGCGGGW